MKLGYSSDNRQDCTHCRFYLKDTPFQNDNAKLLLFRELARGWMIFLFLPRLQQPCHASMGPVRQRASMAAAEFSSHVIPTPACAAAWDLWLRHLGICPSYHENPTLHIGVN